MSTEASDCVLSFVPAEEREGGERFRGADPSCPIGAVELTGSRRIDLGPDGELWMTSGTRLLRRVDDRVEVVVELLPR